MNRETIRAHKLRVEILPHARVSTKKRKGHPAQRGRSSETDADPGRAGNRAVPCASATKPPPSTGQQGAPLDQRYDKGIMSFRAFFSQRLDVTRTKDPPVKHFRYHHEYDKKDG